MSYKYAYFMSLMYKVNTKSALTNLIVYLLSHVSFDRQSFNVGGFLLSRPSSSLYLFTLSATFSNLIGVEFLKTVRADAVSEFGLRMIPDVRFDLSPIPLVVPDLFARGADGKHTA